MDMKRMMGGQLASAPLLPNNTPQKQDWGGMPQGGSMIPQQQQNKRGVGDFIADFVINYGAASGNPMAGGILRNQLAQQRQAAQQKAQQRLYDQRRSDQRADKQWEWQNKPKAEDTFTKRMRAAGIDPQSDEGKGLYRQKVQNEAMDWIEVDDGRGGKRIMPRPGIPAVPTRPVGKLTPVGGASSNGRGGF